MLLYTPFICHDLCCHLGAYSGGCCAGFWWFWAAVLVLRQFSSWLPTRGSVDAAVWLFFAAVSWVAPAVRRFCAAFFAFCCARGLAVALLVSSDNSLCGCGFGCFYSSLKKKKVSIISKFMHKMTSNYANAFYDIKGICILNHKEKLTSNYEWAVVLFFLTVLTAEKAM
jgi:hypothetical protein